MFKIEHMGSLIQKIIYSSDEADIIELDKSEFGGFYVKIKRLNKCRR